MKRSPRQRLQDILDAIGRIEAFIAGTDFSRYQSDSLLHDAVERNVEIISEASRHIPEDLKALRPDIPWRQIADIGNVLRHAYDGIDDRAIWNTVSTQLGILKEAVIQLVAGID